MSREPETWLGNIEKAAKQCPGKSRFKRGELKFSSYNWPHKGERGWVIGPWFGRCVYVTVRRWPRV